MWTRYETSAHARGRWDQRFNTYKESLGYAVGNSRFMGMLHTRGHAWYVFAYRDAAFLFSWTEDGPEASLDTVWPLRWAQHKLES